MRLLFYIVIFITLSGCGNKGKNGAPNNTQLNEVTGNEHQTNPTNSKDTSDQSKDFITLNPKDNLDSCVILHIDSKYRGSLSSPYESSPTNKEYIERHRSLCTKTIQQNNDHCQEVVRVKTQLCQGATTRIATICGGDSNCISEANKVKTENCPFAEKAGIFDPNFYSNILKKYPQGIPLANSYSIISPSDDSYCE